MDHNGNNDWLVETDIANFFPYVQITAVIQHLLSHSDLQEDAVRLLAHMLHVFAPMDEYRTSPIRGLPQENKDCGRILAHTYLTPLTQNSPQRVRTSSTADGWTTS